MLEVSSGYIYHRLLITKLIGSSGGHHGTVTYCLLLFLLLIWLRTITISSQIQVSIRVMADDSF